MQLVGPDGLVTRKFSFTTLAEQKCLFDQTRVASATAQLSASGTVSSQTVRDLTPILICAVPKNTTRFLGATLPDDYLEKDLMTEDGVLEIDLSNGKVADRSPSVQEGVDAISIKATEEAIYFINRYNNKLYRLLRS